MSPSYVVKPVERAIRVLQCAGAASSPMSLKEISARVGLPKTSVFRYLRTLCACGLIAHDADRDLYRVDAGILSLVPQGGGLQRLREIALPHMRSLQQRYNETVNLGILEGVNVVYIEIIESKRALRMQARVGGRDPVHSTAIGKAILAHLPDDIRQQIVPPRLRKRTALTLTSVTSLDAELASTRDRGYALEEGENEEGAACIGAPIFSESGEVSAGISIAAPAARLGEQRRHEIAPVLVGAAERISVTLGFRSAR